uniref:Large ribosomal subunit protein bL17m n=1 Tax=Ciona savignyi TaxID=51511 RepID=H2ZMM9_CIOSA
MPRGFAHGNVFRKLGGHQRRLKLLKILVNALIKNERIETTFTKAHETQKYMNRLIDIAKQGTDDAYTTDMVRYWTEDDSNKRKLFNVLVPRFTDHNGKYTRIAMLPTWHMKDIDDYKRMAVLELKGNPLPPLPIKEDNPHTLQNVLIAAAKSEWKQPKNNV